MPRTPEYKNPYLQPYRNQTNASTRLSRNAEIVRETAEEKRQAKQGQITLPATVLAQAFSCAYE
jgi:nitric oxide reductase activation protein